MKQDMTKQSYYLKSSVHVDMPLILKVDYPLNKSEMVYYNVEVKIPY